MQLQAFQVQYSLVTLKRFTTVIIFFREIDFQCLEECGTNVQPITSLHVQQNETS